MSLKDYFKNFVTRKTELLSKDNVLVNNMYCMVYIPLVKCCLPNTLITAFKAAVFPDRDRLVLQDWGSTAIKFIDN